MEIINLQKNEKIICAICLKTYTKKYKTNHEKTQHHKLSKQIINNVNFKHFECISK